MARPESIREIAESDRFVEIGGFETQHFIAIPTLLKQYTAFIEAVLKQGGRVIKSYGSHINVFIPKTREQLEEQLRSDQQSWDEHQRLYNKALAADEGDPVPEWRRKGVEKWAEKEGLPNPFDVFAANDPELAAIRADLGLND